MNQITLHEILDRRFSLSELHNLAWGCGWPVEDIGTNHHVKSTFLRQLIEYAKRRSYLPQLMAEAAKCNSALSFDGKVLSEQGGDTFDATLPPAKHAPDPRLLRKQEIVAGLRQRNNASVFDALIYLLEETV